MEAEHVPDVFVHEWKITQNEVRFDVSNLGTGVAQSIFAELHFDPVGDKTDSLSRKVELTRRNSTAGVLQPNEQTETIMSGTFSLLEKETIQEWLEEFQAAEVEQLDVTVTLTYEYIRQKYDRKLVYRWRTNVDDAETIEDLAVGHDQAKSSDLNVPPENI